MKTNTSLHDAELQDLMEQALLQVGKTVTE